MGGKVSKIFDIFSKKSSRGTISKKDLDELLKSEFDADYYLAQYPDVFHSGKRPFDHFMTIGWKEGRNPNAQFNTFAYLRKHLDVAVSGFNPFVHYLKYGRKEGRDVPVTDASIAREMLLTGEVPITLAMRTVQNNSIPRKLEQAERIMIILVPEHNEMSGGIYSFFSIANAAYQLRHKHDYEIVLMTRPNPMGETYVRQRNFRNSADVFRFEQVTRFKNAKTIYLQIPEYAVPMFVDGLDEETLDFLRSRENFFVNILNQKTDIMPEPHELESMRAVCHELTQSVAHHAYFGQSFADHYDTPMLLLPAYTDLSSYPALPPEDKEKLIIYSPDEAPWKEEMLARLRAELPDYKLQEIRGIDFDTFMDLATRCRYSITFGEGFDGYLAQPIYQGGVGFAVYNQEFFPSETLQDFDNIFASAEEIVAELPSRIRAMDAAPGIYRKANSDMMAVYDSLYSREDYMKRVEMLIHREFELRPLHMASWSGSVRV